MKFISSAIFDALHSRPLSIDEVGGELVDEAKCGAHHDFCQAALLPAIRRFQLRPPHGGLS
jgi:hypothetical protein